MSSYKKKAKPAYKASLYKAPAYKASAATNAKAIAKIIRNDQHEVKGMDTTFNQTTVSAILSGNDDATPLNLVQMGAGSWNRVGRKIFLKSVRLKGEFLLETALQSTTYAGNTIRLVLIWDKQPTGGTIPAWDQIFGHTTQAGVESTTLMDSIKFDNMNRFRILKDICVGHGPKSYTGTNTYVERFPFDEYIKLNGLETTFSGQSDPMTWADISTGGLLLYARSAIELSANKIAIANSVARIRYLD